MSLLISALITFLVVILILYLINMLPIDGKATISHIIEKFPTETEFVVGVGFLGDQVRQYLQIAHANRRITFVDVDKYDGPGSGPGYSLLCCRKYLQKLT